VLHMRGLREEYTLRGQGWAAHARLQADTLRGSEAAGRRDGRGGEGRSTHYELGCLWLSVWEDLVVGGGSQPWEEIAQILYLNA
jgi:hypothetical protein